MYVFQIVFKFPHSFSMVFKLYVSKCFQKSPGFQWFSNYMFQSVFKFPHMFQCMCFKMFSNFPIFFNGFQMMCFKVFSNFPIGFNGFQMMCFKVFSNFPIGFKEFSSHVLQNYVFQSVFKFLHRIQRGFKWCVSKCFQISP